MPPSPGGGYDPLPGGIWFFPKRGIRHFETWDIPPAYPVFISHRILATVRVWVFVVENGCTEVQGCFLENGSITFTFLRKKASLQQAPGIYGLEYVIPPGVVVNGDLHVETLGGMTKVLVPAAAPPPQVQARVSGVLWESVFGEPFLTNSWLFWGTLEQQLVVPTNRPWPKVTNHPAVLGVFLTKCRLFLRCSALGVLSGGVWPQGEVACTRTCPKMCFLALSECVRGPGGCFFEPN